MRSGRRIAIDHGAARIGIAVSSVDALISSPLNTVLGGEGAVERVLAELVDFDPLEIYVGLPLNLQGEFTRSTHDALSFARQLAKSIIVDVRMVDERLSTRAAQGQLHASGKNSKVSRSIIDAAAASLILEGALDFEKATGRLPGRPLTEFDE
ncbi:MAG: Holliday junction resolvase RuvX [Micrococcales bacterium]